MRFKKRDVSTKRDGEDWKFEVEVPEFESWEEACQASGGEDEALKYFNGAVATGAVNGARATARAAPEGAETDLDEWEGKARTVAKGYKPSGADRGPSKKAKVEAFDALMARMGSDDMPSEEEMRALSEKYAS